MRRAPAAAALLIAALLPVAASALAGGDGPPRFVAGADVSSLPKVRAGGGVFHVVADTVDPLVALREAGVDAVRLRVWHSPADGACGPAATVAMARRARELGLRVMLDLHYSDTWADPAHQTPPAAWQGLALPALADSVRAWTRDVVGACAAAGAAPDWVQLGNEVGGGLLWETGRLGSRGEGWDAVAALLTAAAEGARAGAPDALRVVHVADGHRLASLVWFFAGLERRGVPYEIAAVSYYPWWHGSIEALRSNLATLAAQTGRGVMVAETAYPWTLRWFDGTHNVVGEERQLAQWPATPEGQAAFARAVRAAVKSVPEGRGRGVWWWEPAWIPAPGHGSPWENCALFDSAGVELPALRAFAR